MIRLLLICSASTEAHRRAAFPGDEPLDARGIAEATALKLSKPDRALTSPALRARQTAEALHLEAEIDAALRDVDYGVWTGKMLGEIDKDAVGAWLADPAAAPHGGESIAALFDRVGEFLASLGDGVTAAVTHASVMRAAVAIALDAPMLSFWKIDIAPLARVTLNGDGRRWRLRSILD
jgi:broad specificity phosphatase PhoE